MNRQTRSESQTINLLNKPGVCYDYILGVNHNPAKVVTVLFYSELFLGDTNDKGLRAGNIN